MDGAGDGSADARLAPCADFLLCFGFREAVWHPSA